MTRVRGTATVRAIGSLVARLVGVLLLLYATLGSAPPTTPESSDASNWDVFARNGCATCHRVRGIGEGTVGPDLGRIEGGSGFVDIAAAMWNHVPEMRARMREHNVPWPRFTPQEFSNLIEFLFTAQIHEIARDPVRGQRVFATRGCERCHAPGDSGDRSAPRLAELRRSSSLVLMAAAMWNHVSQLRDALDAAGISRTAVASTEVQDIAAYIATVDSRTTDTGARRDQPLLVGVPDRGQRLFAVKGCAGCHGVGAKAPRPGPSIGPRAPRASVTDLPAVLWNHRAVVDIQPASRLTGQEMADITAYLHASYYFDPPPGDARRGRLRLKDKGCLGCHSIYNKGGRGAPDFANANVVKTKLGQWTAMWNHARIMDNAAKRRGLALPRLTAQDLSDITTYLAGLGSGPPRR
jgi:mono/diheme cytochrome c family protein